MNRAILQKVIDELNKPEPRLDYVRGVLETVMEGLPEAKVITGQTMLPDRSFSFTSNAQITPVSEDMPPVPASLANVFTEAISTQ